MKPYSPEADRDAHFTFITRLGRERLVRSGQAAPVGDDELRQSQEGPKPARELDCMQGPL